VRSTKKVVAAQLFNYIQFVPHAALTDTLSLDSDYGPLIPWFQQFSHVQFCLYGGTVEKVVDALSKFEPVKDINDLDFIATVDSPEEMAGFFAPLAPNYFGPPEDRLGFSYRYTAKKEGKPVDVSVTVYFNHKFNPQEQAVFDTVGMSSVIPIPLDGSPAPIGSHYYDPSLARHCLNSKTLLSPLDLSIRFHSLRFFMRQAKGWHSISEGYTQYVKNKHQALCADGSVDLVRSLKMSMSSHFEPTDRHGIALFLALCLNASKNKDIPLAEARMRSAIDVLSYTDEVAALDSHPSVTGSRSLMDDLRSLSSAWSQTLTPQARNDLVPLVLMWNRTLSEATLTLPELRKVGEFYAAVMPSLQPSHKAELCNNLVSHAEKIPLTDQLSLLHEHLETDLAQPLFDLIKPHLDAFSALSKPDKKGVINTSVQFVSKHSDYRESLIRFVEDNYSDLSKKDWQRLEPAINALSDDVFLALPLDLKVAALVAFETKPFAWLEGTVQALVEKDELNKSDAKLLYFYLKSDSESMLSVALIETVLDRIPKRLQQELVRPFLDALKAQKWSDVTSDYVEEVSFRLWESWPKVMSPQLFSYVAPMAFFLNYREELLPKLTMLSKSKGVIPGELKQAVIDNIARLPLSSWTTLEHELWMLAFVPGDSVLPEYFIADGLRYYSENTDKLDVVLAADLVGWILNFGDIASYQAPLKEVVPILVKLGAELPSRVFEQLDLDVSTGKAQYKSKRFLTSVSIEESLALLRGLDSNSDQLEGVRHILKYYDAARVSRDPHRDVSLLLKFVAELGPPKLKAKALKELFYWCTLNSRLDVMSRPEVINPFMSQFMASAQSPKGVVVVLSTILNHNPRYFQALSVEGQVSLLEYANTENEAFFKRVDDVLSFIAQLSDPALFSLRLRLLEKVPVKTESWCFVVEQLVSDWESFDDNSRETSLDSLLLLLKTYFRFDQEKSTAFVLPLFRRLLDSESLHVEPFLMVFEYHKVLKDAAEKTFESSGSDVLFNALHCDKAGFSRRYIDAVLRHRPLSDLLSFKGYFSRLDAAFWHSVLDRAKAPEDQPALHRFETQIFLAFNGTPNPVSSVMLPLSKKGFDVSRLLKRFSRSVQCLKASLESDDMSVEDKKVLVVMSQAFSQSVLKRRLYASFMSSGIPEDDMPLSEPLRGHYVDFVRQEIERKEELAYQEEMAKLEQDLAAQLAVAAAEKARLICEVKARARELSRLIHEEYNRDRLAFVKGDSCQDRLRVFRESFLGLDDDIRRDVYLDTVSDKRKGIGLLDVLFIARDKALFEDAKHLKVLSNAAKDLNSKVSGFYIPILLADDREFLSDLLSFGVDPSVMYKVRGPKGEVIDVSLFVLAESYGSERCADLLASQERLGLEVLKGAVFETPSQMTALLELVLDKGVARAHERGHISKDPRFVQARTGELFRFLSQQHRWVNALDDRERASLGRILTLLIENGYVSLSLRVPVRLKQFKDMSLAELVSYQAYEDKKGVVLSLLKDIDSEYFKSPDTMSYGKLPQVLMFLATSGSSEVASLGLDVLTNTLSAPPSKDDISAFFHSIENERGFHIAVRVIEHFKLAESSSHQGFFLAIHRFAPERFQKRLCEALFERGYKASLDEVKVYMTNISSVEDADFIHNVMIRSGHFELEGKVHLLAIIFQFVPEGFRIHMCRRFMEQGIGFVSGEDVQRIELKRREQLLTLPLLARVLMRNVVNLFPTSIYALKHASAKEFRELKELGMVVDEPAPTLQPPLGPDSPFTSLLKCAVFYYNRPNLLLPVDGASEEAIAAKKEEMLDKIQAIDPTLSADDLPEIDYSKVPFFAMV
jgi:hypothetical protein